ncbi:hypothetical protein LTS10_003682 [Elasticomyces elasticus]|nr:hypothetical protein LTS10_003682 [Elasticomyces elasticus]
MAISTDTAATAVETVFGTTELLEAILLGLDTQECDGLQTLLLSQRVNRMFKATIAHSPNLQEALFFRPTLRKDLQNTDKQCGALNPLLLKLSGKDLGPLDLTTSEIRVWCSIAVSEEFATRCHPGEWRARCNILTTSSIMASVVLGTVELLEAILLELGSQDRKGLKTLLLSQRVCKTFQATIKNSPGLQEVLFFRPVKPSQGGSGAPKQAIRFNELLLHRDENEASASFWDFGAGRHSQKKWTAHAYSVTAHICKTDKRCVHARFEQAVALSIVIKHYEPVSVVDSMDSWQRMLLVQSGEAVRVRSDLKPYFSISVNVLYLNLEVGQTVGGFLKGVWRTSQRP